MQSDYFLKLMSSKLGEPIILIYCICLLYVWTLSLQCSSLIEQSWFLPGTMLHFKILLLAGIKLQETFMTEMHLPLYYPQWVPVISVVWIIGRYCPFKRSTLLCTLILYCVMLFYIMLFVFVLTKSFWSISGQFCMAFLILCTQGCNFLPAVGAQMQWRCLKANWISEF